ncbi:prophage tail gpP-like protein [Acinetobacter calcoaceticus]|uniref:Prophage tail gpP-like protein n=1 Tax=Acinetobacter calcoaceticus TaxID=471 RepID=A0A4V2QZS5_ACICA|nr:prophage tail gpP-like protein [Acinetobacter calcoaceticus]
MQDNQGREIRLVIGGYEIKEWDKVEVDSQIDTPSENWSLSLFQNEGVLLPESIQGGAAIELYYANELILTSIADKVSEAVSRDGYGLQISGRDLVGQLIDCSVPIFNGRQITLEELIGKFVLSGDLGSIFHNVKIQNNAWLKNKISIEPSESLWDAIVKAAQVTGQHVWLDPDGTLQIGDPFANPYYVKMPLRLMKPSNNENNVLSLHYDNDVSNVYSQFKVLSQDAKGQHILAETKKTTQYAFNRLKILTLSDVETATEANNALEKIKKDNDFESHTLTATVADWTIDNKVWSTGWHLNLETNALTHANAKWAVVGRTLNLDRSSGKTTRLLLKRQGDWSNPLVHKDKEKPKTKKKAKDKKKETDTKATIEEQKK